MSTPTVGIPFVADANDLDRVVPSYTLTAQNTVVYSCGGCGRLTHFAEGKTVDNDGNVSPSMLCRSCGWHVFGKLSDWKCTEE